MKYIFEAPEGVTIKDGAITMTGGVGWQSLEKAIHNAKEAVEFDPRQLVGRFTDGRAMVKNIKGPVTLYAVKGGK